MSSSILTQVESLIESAIPMSHVVVYDPRTGFVNQKHGTMLSVSEEESGVSLCVFRLLQSSLKIDVVEDLERNQRHVKMNKEETISSMMYELTRRLDDSTAKHQKRIKKDRVYFRSLLGSAVPSTEIDKIKEVLLNVYSLYYSNALSSNEKGKAMMAMCRAMHQKYRR